MRIEGKVDGKNRKGEGRCEKIACRERPLWRSPMATESTDLNWFAIQQGTGRRPFPTRTARGKGRPITDAPCDRDGSRLTAQNKTLRPN